MQKKKPSPLGQRIKAVREKRVLSQNQLAKIAGVSSPAVTRIENGTAQDLTTQTAIKFAEALGLTVDELLGVGGTSGDDVPPTLESVEANQELFELAKICSKLHDARLEAVSIFARFASRDGMGLITVKDGKLTTIEGRRPPRKVTDEEWNRENLASAKALLLAGGEIVRHLKEERGHHSKFRTVLSKRNRASLEEAARTKGRPAAAKRAKKSKKRRKP